MAVEVIFKDAGGSQQEFRHERGDYAEVSDGHLFVRTSPAGGRDELVGGYAPGAWITFTIQSA